MSFRRSYWTCWTWAAALVVAALTLPDAPANAQGLFDFFHNGGQQRGGWGGWFGQQRRQYVPQQASPFADPGQYGSEPSRGTVSHGGGRSVGYCVRLCDGRYFPIQRHSNASSVQLCSAFCPAAKTQVFNGSQIDHAMASNGARYADLENAFVYRQKIVPDCSCNGKDSFGLARIDVASDPTLRSGDIVASGDNVKAALIAMEAAKERGRDREAAAAERAAGRTTGRRTATTAPVPPPSAVPTEPTDDLPED